MTALADVVAERFGHPDDLAAELLREVPAPRTTSPLLDLIHLIAREN